MSDAYRQGRLQVVESLSSVEILLPPDLRPARFLFWIFGAIPPLVAGTVGLVSGMGTNLVLGVALFAFTLALVVLLWKILALAVERVGRRPLLPLGLVFLLVGAATVLCASDDLGTGAALGLGAATGLVHAGLLWLFSVNRATLSLDQHSLKARRLWTRLELPLEDLDGVERVGQVFPRLKAGGRMLPASGDVDDTELAWLDARVRAEARRRRWSLHRQGEDMGQQPQPPAELVALLEGRT